MSQREVTVKLAIAQRDAIMKFLDDHPELGYKSFADFVTDAVREKYRELLKEYKPDDRSVF